MDLSLCYGGNHTCCSVCGEGGGEEDHMLLHVFFRSLLGGGVCTLGLGFPNVS